MPPKSAVFVPELGAPDAWHLLARRMQPSRLMVVLSRHTLALLAAGFVGPGCTLNLDAGTPERRDSELRTLPLGEGDQPSTRACAPEAHPSLLVELRDGMGYRIASPSARVSFAVEDEVRLQPAVCLGIDCELWSVGADDVGAITVTAAACGGEGATTTSVKMTRDGCHVDTKHVGLTVHGADCGTQTHPDAPICTPDDVPRERVCLG